MTDLFVGRQPIFDRQLAVVGYELLYRPYDANQTAGVDADQETTQLLLNAFAELGIETLVGGKLVYLSVTRNFLTGKFPIPMPPARVVLQFAAEVAPDDELLDALGDLSAQGYRLALTGVASFERLAPYLDVIDLARIDLPAIAPDALAQLVTRVRTHAGRIQLLAAQVETQDDLELCKGMGFDFFQGYFLCKPDVVQGRRVAPVKMVMLQTLARIQDPQIDFRTLGGIIAQDVALSYKLLRLINSAYYGVAQRITSVDQAISLIGVNQLRSWLTLLLLSAPGDKPHELTLIAMSRAKLCELLARTMKQTHTEPFFLTGLFSVLDALMDVPMQQALDQLPLSREVIGALLRREGMTGTVLNLALAYERGDLDKLFSTTIQPDVLRQSYLQAVQWTAQMEGAMGAM